MAEQNLEIFSGICPAPCVLHQYTVVFARKCRLSCCACVGNAAYIISIYHVEFYICGLDAWYHSDLTSVVVWLSWGEVIKTRTTTIE